jgi:hypothetical protein
MALTAAASTEGEGVDMLAIVIQLIDFGNQLKP